MAEETQVYDVVMIGAGPTSLAAAVYTSREDISTLVVEKGIIGGLTARITVMLVGRSVRKPENTSSNSWLIAQLRMNISSVHRMNWTMPMRIGTEK